ncbi:MAG: hypothetical protein SGI77_06385 [Pirellulaceae bacterium]|nr:hypothetical protein [Pirellulaceae bacterium]
MSGPKDYSISINAARRAAIAASQAAQRRARDEQLRRRAEENRQRLAAQVARMEEQRRQLLAARNQQISMAESRLADVDQAARTSINKLLAEKASRNRDALARRQIEFDEVLKKGSDELLEPDVDERTSSGFDSVFEETEILSSSPTELKDAIPTPLRSIDAKLIQERLTELMNWKFELTQDENVTDFQNAERDRWLQVLKDEIEHSNSSDDAKRLLDTEKLIQDAKSIFESANEIESKLQIRNEILASIIASLKEIGFVVRDPYYEDAAQPDQPVHVHASRGTEFMKATIDLDQEIRSVWNDIEAEHCKSTFFSYIDAMEAKGLEVKPKTDGLENRPILKQRGAKSLPKSKQNYS